MKYCFLLLMLGVTAITAAEQGGGSGDSGSYVNFGAGVNIINDVDVKGGGTAEFDPGFRFSVAAGYRFTPMISAEFETGFLYNEVKTTGDTLSQVPFLANVVFRFENSSSFVPFIGAGAGGIAGLLIFEDAFPYGDDIDVVFAWQVQAGVHYRINDNVSAGITYKYLGADSPEFKLGSRSIPFEVMHNHAILVSLNWSF